MANRIFDLILQMQVDGIKDADQLLKLIEELRKKAEELANVKLNKLLDIDTKNLDIDLTRVEALSREMERLRERAAQARIELRKQMDVLREKVLGDAAAQTAKYTEELEKLREAAAAGAIAVARVARSVTDARKLFQAGKLKFDLDVGDAKNKIDFIITNVKRIPDIITEAGKTPLHFNTAEFEAAAQRAIASAQRLGNEVIKLHRAATGLKGGAKDAAAAVQDMGAAARQTTGPFAAMRESIETTGRELLLLRRLAFGLGFSFVAREILDTVKAFDALEQSVKAVFGADQTAEEMSFIRTEAERLGLQITGLGKEYSKLAAATKAAGFTQQETRDIFLSVAEAGAKLSLSQEEIQGALTAVQQIASKGRVSLEELRQQLGDRLPGAIQIAAKSLGITERRLFALVEQGQLASDVFLRVFPAAIRASFGTDATTRIENTSASIQRFKNAMAEFSNTVARSGALEGFITFLQKLAELSKDKAVIDFFKTLSSILGGLFAVLRDHTTAIKDLILVYLGFKSISFVIAVLSSLSASLRLTAASATAAAGANTAYAASAATATGATGLFTAALTLLNKAFVPIAVGAAAIDVLFSVLEKGQEAALKFAEAQRQIVSTAKLAPVFEKQKEALDEWKTTINLSTKEIRSLSDAGVVYYKNAVEGARNLTKVTLDAIDNQIKGLNAQLEILRLSGDRSEKAQTQAKAYRDRIAELAKAQAAANAELEIYNKTLVEVIVVARQRDLTFDAGIQKLRDLAATFVPATENAKRLNDVKFEELDRETQSLIAGFKNVIAEGKSIHEALKKAFPADIADGTVKSVTQVANALEIIQQEGLATGKVITDELAKKLDKFTANELLTFQLNARQAFQESTIGAKGLALVVDGVTKAALKNMGVDVEAVGERVSKTFREMIDNLTLIGINAKQTAGIVKAAMDKAIATAKSRDELQLLSNKLVELGLDGTSAVDGVRDSFTRLQDKILSTKGVLDSALGDSFKFFAINTTEHLRAMAELAIIHFNRIKDSGLAAAKDLREAWIKMFDATELGQAFRTLGIQSSIALQGIADTARESFRLVSDSGVATAEGLIKAYDDVRAKAVAAGEGTKNLIADNELLMISLQKAFNAGTISAVEYQKALIEATTKTRDAAVVPIGAVQAAFATFGAKTRSQLIELYRQAVESFNIVANSGQATSEVLQNAAAEVEKRWIAAFGAIEDAAKTAFNNVSSFTGFRRDFGAFDAQELKRASIDDLKNLLKDLEAQASFQTRPGSNPDPEFLRTLLLAIQQLVNELNRRGEQTGLPTKPVQVNNNGTYNFNFNGVLPDINWIRNFLIPELDKITLRKA